MMELSPGGGNGGNVVQFPMRNACQNTEEEVEPEAYDFSSFFEGDIIDDAFLEFKEMLTAASFPSSRPVVPEVVDKVVAEKNMEHLVQRPPHPTHPRRRKRIINLSIRDCGSIKWTKELDGSFLDAVRQLGGAFIATPKTVLDLMDVEGLSLRQVKSHLQKYRGSKSILEEWKKVYKRGSSFSRAIGAPSKPGPISKPSQAKKQCRCSAKLNKQGNGSLQMNIQDQKHLPQLSEVQRQNAEVAASRMAVNKTTRERTSAANQKTGAYPFAVNQNIGGRVFPANQNFGGHVCAANQKMGGCALAGRKTYPENGFINGVTITLMPMFQSNHLNQYSGCASAAAVPAGIFVAEKSDKLPSIPAAHPYQLTETSNLAKAASDSYQQGFNSDSGESSGTAEMSDDEFVNSFLVDYDQFAGDSQDNQ